MSGKMRAVLIDWLIEVHSQFKLLQETLYMTVYVIDKFLQVIIPTVLLENNSNLSYSSDRGLLHQT